MANHNNFGKDMEALFESYSKVEGQIPSTANTAMPRMLNEAHCDEEHEGGEETVKVELELELDKETAKKLHDQLMDEVVEEEPAEGELPAEDGGCATHSDEEHAEDGEHEDGEHEDGERILSQLLTTMHLKVVSRCLLKTVHVLHILTKSTLTKRRKKRKTLKKLLQKAILLSTSLSNPLNI